MLKTYLLNPITHLRIPPLGGTDSLVHVGINVNMTDVFKTPLVPGPASSYKAIYTALMRAQGISAWSCCESLKAIISLDLDLYEKCYTLVHSREDMRDKCILRLGELHAVFAHIRAIGALIVCSGLEDAWIEAEWFDSDSVIRQVLECKHMKRAVDAHEASMLTLMILQLMEMMRSYPEYFVNACQEIIDSINNANHALLSKDVIKFRSSFFKLKHLLVDIDFKDRWDEFQESKYAV